MVQINQSNSVAIKAVLDAYNKSTEFLGLTDAMAEEASSVTGLVELVQSDEKHPYPQYASHLLLHIARKGSKHVNSHYNELVDVVMTTPNTSVRRNLLGVLLCFPLQPYKEGELLDWLFQLLNNPTSQPGLLNYAVKKLAQYVVQYPELKTELFVALEMREGLSEKKGLLAWGHAVLKSTGTGSKKL